MLKDIVTIFYEPLAKVYKAANIADSLYDLQGFINDLIKTVELAEEGSSLFSKFERLLINRRSANLSDPQRTVQIFVDLVARHEARFYHFVHQVHSKGEGLFDNLMKWIELFINFVRAGLPSPVSLEYLLPHAGKEREAVLQEVDSIIDYHRKLKAAHHERMRRRMIRGEAGVADTNGDAAFVGGVMENLQMSSVLGDVQEFNNEDSEEDADDTDQEDNDSEDDFQDALSETTGSLSLENHSSSPSGIKPLPLIPGGLVPIISKKAKGRKKDRVPIELPTLKIIPSLVPIFVELVRGELEEAREAVLNPRVRELPDIPDVD